MNSYRSSAKSRFDAVIVGGGHNGLTCACYLAKSGLSVGVFERRGILGGAAVTEEFHPGFRNSTASYTVSLLNPKVIRDLRLAEHGLKVLERPMQNFLPLPDGRALTAGPAQANTVDAIRGFSNRDAERIPAYFQMLDGAVAMLRSQLLETPPTNPRRLRDLWGALQLGRHFRKLEPAVQRDIHELFTRSAGDLLDHWFESDAVKALYGFDAVVGNYASPYTPGSGYVLLHHVFGEVNGVKGAWGHAIGGMGAITQAMAKAATAAGVEIRTREGVREVVIDDGRAVGVVSEKSELIHARAVVANVNPKLLYERLIARAAVPAPVQERMANWRCGSGTFRMNVALAELPRFTALPEPGDHLTAGIIMAPSLDYMDRAYLDARRYGWSKEPIVEMLIPSTLDDSLAPAGKHVASLFCQHVAPELPDGKSWDDHREEVADLMIATVDRFAPGFKASVLGRQIKSPLDLERDFGLIGGDIFHGALSLNQLFSARPMIGYADYRGALPGLYLCGAGTHPGGGVTGAPGHNAAKVIARDLR